MASLLDEYEKQQSQILSRTELSKQVHTRFPTGALSTSLAVETPIFNWQKIKFSFPTNISHLVVSNNYVVIAMVNNVLLRIDQTKPDQFDEVDLKAERAKSEEKIHKLFLDPSGKHLLISLNKYEVMYLSRSSKRPKLLTQMRGHIIESIAWNYHDYDDHQTGPMLLGTSKGVILETNLTATEDGQTFSFQRGPEKYVTQLYCLPEERPVMGLEMERVPGSTLTEKRYIIMATTTTRLYQFLGNVPSSAEAPILKHVFQIYENKHAPYQELPGTCSYSELRFFRTKAKVLPKHFAWMTGPGILYGKLDYAGAQVSATASTRLVRYHSVPGVEPGAEPLSLALTDFHVLVLYPDTLHALCVLNDQLVLQEDFSLRYGRLLGLAQDPLYKGTVWVYAEKAVFKYRVVREGRNVWQIYLNQGDYTRARDYARDTPSHLEQVVMREAEHYMSRQMYAEAADTYAQAWGHSFEEIVLKFIPLKDKEPLKIFLRRKIDTLNEQDKSQMTMLVMWVVEVFLTQLGECEGDEGRHKQLQADFHAFLTEERVKVCCMEKYKVVYDLMSTHANLEDLVYFALMLRDYERVIEHYLQHDKPSDALNILSSSSQKRVDLFYKFSPTLMQTIPHELVDAWISKGSQLDPKQLIPALVHYDQDRHSQQGNEAIRYLEHVVRYLDNKDQAIHNYLLSLYAKLQPDQLLNYLKFQGQDASCVCYDVKYALRLCTDQQLHRPCVHIYTTMGLYEEAVALALKVDVDLAKTCANLPQDNAELRKKLWLRIARHVVEHHKDIKTAMDFVHESELVKIEDVLPFFPDFVTIDHFKDAICESLRQYNAHIESLKVEMDDATEAAQEIREEIQSFRNKYSKVHTNDQCSACCYPLLSRAFYLFPCHHMFHTDCLLAEVTPHLSRSLRVKVEEVKAKLQGLAREGKLLADPDTSSLGSINPLSTSTTPLSKYEQFKAEIDDIIASECAYCGDMMVRSIDTPFISAEEYGDVMEQWL